MSFHTFNIQIINWDKHLSSVDLNSTTCYNCNLAVAGKNDYIIHLYGPTSCLIANEYEQKTVALSSALIKYGDNILKYSI